jgi:TRAP-type C4-dicarboxylate transport system permease small subunit
MIRRVLDGLYLLAGWLAGLFLLAIFLLMMAMSLGRLPALRLNITDGDQFVAWSMAAVAFLGLAHTFRSGEMIRVGLLIDRLHGPVHRAFEIVSLALGLGFIGFFAFHAVGFVRDSFRFDDMAQGVLPIPLWIPQLGYVTGLVILAIAFLDEFIHVVRGGAPRYEKPPPQSAEEVVERAAASAV